MSSSLPAPYYAESGITIYHGDCRTIVHQLVPADIVITDPPYDRETHEGARTLDKVTRVAASTGQRAIVASAPIPIDFAALPDLSFTGHLWQLAARWCLTFCSLEMLGDYRRWAGESWVRSGFWHRPDGAPQISGDRPAQPGEGIAITHRPGAKRWNGGGHHAFYSFPVVKHQRVHPTQKPLALMSELVALYSEPGELIMDPFMGSGTTLVAAKSLGRQAIGIELDEQQCANAVQRLRQNYFNFEE